MDAEIVTRARKERNEPPSGRRFLTRKEAARELRISFNTLDRMIGRGALKAKKHGHSTIILPTVIERYLEQLPALNPNAPKGAHGG